MAELTLQGHAVFEASAGTGKTHTLEQLVLQLLTSGRAQLDQILLVTYTEKAAGELKARLRRTLENQLPRYPRLQEALDSFDQASVQTIHAFCHRVLQEHAFENRHDFHLQLVDDNDIVEPCLRELQRKGWRQEYGPALPAVLALAGYATSTTDIKNWERKVKTLALRYRPACGHQLVPAPDPERLSSAADVAGEERQLLEAQLVVRTVQQLQQQLAEYKRERGLESYEDMLIQVDRALDPASNPRAALLLLALRQRYRYAIVDEFQDTDPVQWRIFRRIFVEGGGQGLIVVGDPKQAIFAFRGADLEAFSAARAELIEKHGAAGHRLDVNWRSSPELLAALNQLFDAGGWFKEPKITYTPVQPPPPAERIHQVVSDKTGRKALVLVDSSGAERLSRAREQHARFIAHEIRRLLGLGPALEFRDQGELQALGPNHIGILVYRRKEADPVIEALRTARIAYTFYKQPGLWQTAEARQLEFLLRTLALPEQDQPFRRALLTRFFAIRPEQLALADDVTPAGHEHFQWWRELAQQRRWSELFASLLQDTGVLYRELAANDGERRLANYRHLIGSLEQRAYTDDLDLLGLLEAFADSRRRPDGRDSDLQPIETDRPKVRIMTIHAAKGLEFPIVFLAGGFTPGPLTQDFASYRTPQGNVVFDLLASDAAKKLAKEEKDGEDRRLLYVALTRAMFKLYVPLLDPERNYRAVKGPVVTIMGRASQEARLADSTHVEVVRPEHPQSACPSVETAPATNAGSALLMETDLLPRLEPDLARRRIFVRSFSSLHRSASEPSDPVWADVKPPPRADDDLPDALADQPGPRGPVFGDLVHALIDGSDFTAVARAAQPAELLVAGSPSRDLIDNGIALRLSELAPRGASAQLVEHCRQLVARLVWQGLRTPLARLGGPLAEVPLQDRLHELEFHFPEEAGARPGAHEAFLTGFMDLVVRRSGKLFLIDWKTNDLPGYAPAQLQQNMLDCDYDRQYRLYLQALARWLKCIRGRDLDLKRDLGGVYYLYLRGMNGLDENTGVFFTQPTAADLELARVLR